LFKKLRKEESFSERKSAHYILSLAGALKYWFGRRIEAC